MVKMIQRAGRARLLGVTKTISKKKVKVGYFADNGMHPHAKMAFASLMYLMEVHGVHAKNGLVRRRAFEITSRMHKREIIQATFRGIKRAYMTNAADLDNTIGAFGKEFEKKIKDTFGSGLLPPNSPVTIAIKGRNEPLVDTGELRAKLSYRVTDK